MGRPAIILSCVGGAVHIRSIKPSFFRDKDLIRLEPVVRLAFIGLWCAADREGKLEDDAEQLAIDVFPRQTVDVEAVLAALTPKMIIRFESGTRKFIKIRNFLRHQRPHHTEAPSVIPEPSQDDYRLANGELPGFPQVISAGREGKGRERKGVVLSAGPENGPGPTATIPPNLVGWLRETQYLGPLADQHHAGFWRAQEAAYDQYPWLYFEEEIRKADAWIAANPTRKPTDRGLTRFIRSWLERSVERGRRYAQRPTETRR